MSIFGRLFRRRAGSPLPPPGSSYTVAPRAAYMRDGRSPFLATWRPGLRDANTDVQAAFTLAAARATDLIQNSGWIDGGVQKAVRAIMGAGLRLNAMPDPVALGVTPAAAAVLARDFERRWDAYARDAAMCDAAGRQTLAQMMSAALRQWFGSGEIVATLPYISRAGATGPKVRLIPSHRLMADRTDVAAGVVQGVRLDADGWPTAYWFRLPARTMTDTESVVAARDDVGRAQVVHVFDGLAGQVRGITPLVSSLHVTRAFDELAGATLTAALVQAIFAATIESQAPTADVLTAFQSPGEQGLGGNIEDYLSARSGWYRGADVDIGRHGKIAHLFVGEKMTLHRSEHPNDTYEAFARMLLREIAAGLGITYEMLTGDYTGATYSSVRMSTAEAWLTTLYRRDNIAAAFLNPIYSNFLEDEIEAGRLAIPGGLDRYIGARSAIARCSWRGPAKPQADDAKAAAAHTAWYKLGAITLEQICADLGQDWEDVAEQLAREKAKREELGIPDPEPDGSPAPQNDNEAPATPAPA